MVIIVATVVLAIYLACPIVGKIALLLANTILPDPLPFVDEIIMWIGLLMNLLRLMSIAEFVKKHKKTIIIAFIIVVALFIIILFLV